MLARISTVLPATEDQLWQRLVEPGTLQFVAAPMLAFVPLQPEAFRGRWVVGKDYELKLYLFGFIPLGLHRIRLVSLDRAANTIVSRESGTLAPVWNHVIRFRQAGDGTLRYTDEIEIRAGWLTPAVWLFAHLFYRHRQRRWKALLEQTPK
jgi:hypothetical protein